MPILDWMTRDEDVVAAARVPYRMLEAVPALDGGDGDPANMLIQGDNLDALKALLPYYAGRVKCIYIDPPYNTASAFEHYDDNLEHAQWLAICRPRPAARAGASVEGRKAEAQVFVPGKQRGRGVPKPPVTRQVADVLSGTPGAWRAAD